MCVCVCTCVYARGRVFFCFNPPRSSFSSATRTKHLSAWRACAGVVGFTCYFVSRFVSLRPTPLSRLRSAPSAARCSDTPPRRAGRWFCSSFFPFPVVSSASRLIIAFHRKRPESKEQLNRGDDRTIPRGSFVLLFPRSAADAADSGPAVFILCYVPEPFVPANNGPFWCALYAGWRYQKSTFMFYGEPLIATIYRPRLRCR